MTVGGDDDASSQSSVSTVNTALVHDESTPLRHLVGLGHPSSASQRNQSPRASGELLREKVTLYREDQRVSLRAFLRTFLQNKQIAESKSMHEFLTGNPIRLNEEEMGDIMRRKEMDERRIEEQRRFYEIARQRAKELDVYMERFRRDIVENSIDSRSLIMKVVLIHDSDGLTKLFKEIKEKETIDELSIEYKKFAEWLRIESGPKTPFSVSRLLLVELLQLSIIFS